MSDIIAMKRTRRETIKLIEVDDGWCATQDNTDLMGEGATPADAIINFCEQIKNNE